MAVQSLMASKWAQSHEKMPPSSPASPAPPWPKTPDVSEAGREAPTSITSSRCIPTAAKITEPWEHCFVKGLDNSIWAPNHKQKGPHVSHRPERPDSTFTITEPEPRSSVKSFILSQPLERPADLPIDELFRKLVILDEEMPDAPPEEHTSSDTATVSSFTPRTLPKLLPASGLTASRWAHDEGENLAPEQFLGKRRIRSDNSAELPKKIPKIELDVFYTTIEPSRAQGLARRNARKRKSQIKLSRARVAAQNVPKTSQLIGSTPPTGSAADRSHPSQRTKRGGVYVQNGQRVGGHAREIGSDSVGHKLLLKMGWTKGKALGKDGSGLLKPVEQIVRTGTAGLGCVISKERDKRHASGPAPSSRSNTTVRRTPRFTRSTDTSDTYAGSETAC